MAASWTPDQAQKLLDSGKINQKQFDTYMQKYAPAPAALPVSDAMAAPSMDEIRNVMQPAKMDTNTAGYKILEAGKQAGEWVGENFNPTMEDVNRAVESNLNTATGVPRANTSGNTFGTMVLQGGKDAASWLGEQISDVFGDKKKDNKNAPTASMKAAAILDPEKAQKLFDQKKISKDQYERIFKIHGKETPKGGSDKGSTASDRPTTSSMPTLRSSDSTEVKPEGSWEDSKESSRYTMPGLGFVTDANRAVSGFVNDLTAPPPALGPAAGPLPATEPNLVDKNAAAGIQGMIPPPPLTGVPSMPQNFKIPVIDRAGSNQMIGALRKQGDITSDGAAKEAALQNEAANIYAKQAEENERQAAFEKQHIETVMNEFKTSLDEIRSKPIENDRYWKDKTTGQKVMAGIGMIFGALGSNNGRNSAVDVINKAIERDVEAQKVDRANEFANNKMKLDGKRTMYDMMLDKFKNERTAKNATMLLGLERVKAQIGAQASTTKSAMAKEQANFAIGQINQSMASLQGELAASLMKKAQENMPKPEDMRKTAVNVNGQPYYAWDHESAMQARKMTSESEPGIKALSTIIQKTKTGSRFDIDNDRDIQILTSMAQASLKTGIIGPGPVTDSEREIVKEIVSDPSGFFTRRDKSQRKLEVLKLSLQKKYLDSIAPYLQIDPRAESQFPSLEER